MPQAFQQRLLIIFVSCLFVLTAAAEFSEKDRQATATELKQLRQRIQVLRQELDAKHSQHSQAQQQLRTLEKDIGSRVRKIRALKQQLNKQNRRLHKLQKQQKNLQARLAKQRDLLGRQIRAAYIIGQQEYLKLLLNQQDPAAAGRMVTYYDYFNRARSQQIEQALATITELGQLEKTIRSEKLTLDRLYTRQVIAKKALQKSYRSRAKLVASLGKEIKSKGQQLQQLSENEKQLQHLLRTITENIPDILTAQNRQQLFSKLRGKLNWPASGRVKKVYGLQRSKSNSRWNGVMIAAKEGNNVYAVSRGRVVYADWLRGYGLLMILDHGDGYMSLYGHNQSLFKEIGDWVESGEVIASIGNSGGQTQAGLYFEIRHNGKPSNPAYWCRGTRRS